MDISLPGIDVVLPCYNPHENWEDAVINNFAEIQTELKDKAKLYLIIVNDGSKKNVEERNIAALKSSLQSLNYISNSKNMGKGFALRTGVAQSKSDYCIYTDIDFPYTTESFINLATSLIQSESDIVAGNRSEVYYQNMPKSRVRISKFLKRVIAGTLRLRLKDTQCGLKGFNSKGRKIFLATTINRYLFDMEFIYMASSIAEVRLKPIAVTLKENIIFSKMNLRILLTEGFNFMKIYLKSVMKK